MERIPVGKGWSVDSSIDQPESAKIAVRWFDAMLKKQVSRLQTCSLNIVFRKR